MRILYILVLLFFFAHTNSYAQLEVSYNVRGIVVDEETGEPLPGANVLIKGSVLGTVTSGEGTFSLILKALPATLTITYVGFKTSDVQVLSAEERLVISLVPGPLLGEEIVVTASRMEESILKSPVAIEKLDARAMKESPASSFYDALENVKGVQMTTSSISFKIPNTRGFNIPNNFRFVQVVDGIDMQAATLGVPLGNAVGPTELDIESVEITPGAASALYGMNAINGMANLITKSPFLYPGLSVFQKTGVNHVDGIDYSPSVLTETAVRYAKSFNDRLAFKVNASYLQATDWRGNTATDQNPNTTASTGNPAFSQLNIGDHPAYDAWNKYGDDGGSNAVTISGINYDGNPNQSFVLRRTGYWERELVPGRVDNLKFDAAVHYRVTTKAEISYAYRYGKMDGLFQRGNKIQLDNTTVQNHKVELKGAHYTLRSYLSIENTGDSYNLKPLADNLDLTHLSNAAWGARFKTALQNELDEGVSLEEAMRRARTAADEGRVVQGTTAFNELKDKIVTVNNWDHLNAGVPSGTATGGAALKQRSRMYHTDFTWDFSETAKFANIIVGADFRVYEVIPDGNNFVDFKRPLAERTLSLGDGSFGDNLYYTKYGFFSQITKVLFGDRLKLSGSLRLDRNLEFDAKLNPRIAAVYTVAEKHNLRVSYQNGFRFPALFEAMSFVNNGNIRRVGGLPYINEGLNYLDNSYTLASVNSFNAAVRADVASGSDVVDAAYRNGHLLEVTNLAPTRPEKIDAFEIGYKSVLFDNTLIIDLDVYTNIYDGFLGQVEVSVPYLPDVENPAIPGEQVTVGTDEAVIAMLQSNRTTRQTRYRVFTNAKLKYNNYGSALGVSYNFFGKFVVAGNANYNNISRTRERDIFVTGFNTPQWATNLSFGNRELFRNFGFNVVWRWQDSFTWESPLANGMVPTYNTLDAQFTYKIPSLYAAVKVGGTNILNDRYIQYAAGPTIGALYYVAVTLDGLLKE